MKLKKLLISLISVVVLTFFGSLSIYAAHEDPNEKGIYTKFGTSYYVYDTPDDYDLGYGVTYRRDLGYTSINESGLQTGQISGLGGGGNLVLGEFYHQQTNILEVKTSDTTRIIPYANLSGSNWVLTSVKKSAQLYEAENPGWYVIAAINGDFFNTSVPYGSTGVTVSNGEFYKSSTSEDTLVFKNDGVGEQVYSTNKTSSAPMLAIYDADDNIIKEIKIDSINTAPQDGQTSVYFRQRTSDRADTWRDQTVENAWLVSNADKAVTITVNNFYGIGKIQSFVTNSQAMKTGEFAIATKNSEITDLLGTGVKIRVQCEFTDESMKDVENAISYPHVILYDKDSWGTGPDTVRHPRTMIGTKEDGTIVMAVTDGRQCMIERPEGNIHNEYGYHGLCAAEEANLMSYYGCVKAWNLDGGGSSTLLVRKQSAWTISSAYKDSDSSSWYVTNSPSDGGERSDGNCLLIAVKIPTFEVDAIREDKSMVLNVTTIEELEKYREIYVELNGTKKKVEDGKVTFDGLTPVTTYEYKLFEKVEEQYLELFQSGSFTTARSLPQITSIEYALDIVKGENIPQLKLNILNPRSLTKITLVVNDDEYTTTYTTIDLTELKINLLNCESYKIIVEYDLEDGKGKQELEINNPDFKLVSAILMLDKMDSDFSNALSDLLK